MSLTPLARLFYVSLWCEADREGRLEWKPRTLKMRYLPGDDCDVVSLGRELLDLGLVVLYDSDGKQYAEIPTFKKHQIINNREAASAIPPRVPIPSVTRASRVKAEGKEGKGREGDSVEPQGVSPPTLPPPEPVIRIPLVGGDEHPILQAQVDEWIAAYPAVGVVQQLREMRAWCIANPSNRKTARGVQAFVVRWLAREQDRAPKVGDRINGRGGTILLPTAATPDEAMLRRISEANGGATVQRMDDGRMRCGVRYYRPDGREEHAI